MINRILHGRLEIRNFSSSVENISLVCFAHLWNIFQHSKRNFVSPHGHVISFILSLLDDLKCSIIGYFYLSLQACQNTVRSHDTTCTLDCPTCDNLCSCRYCQAVYPSKDVSNIVEANKRVLVDNSLVTPYRCLGWYKKLNACVCILTPICVQCTCG